jgi:eukaryotic-like serine/threonine-protein kinase
MGLVADQMVAEKYRVHRLIGTGAMGQVFEATDLLNQTKVAIKILLPDVPDKEEATIRFRKEAEVVLKIGSEHVTTILDVGELPTGEPYTVMEYLEGVSLTERIGKSGRLSAADSAQIAIQILEGLQAAHESEIIHRDLKPDNIFLLASANGRNNFVKIIDFGISKSTSASQPEAMKMTRTGMVMGTPCYLSPEQAKGAKDYDFRVDIYAVGVILYESVTGQVPFMAKSMTELLFKIVLDHPEPLSELVPGLEPSFISLVSKAMARQPEQRFASAKAFQQALLDWLGKHHPALLDESIARISNNRVSQLPDTVRLSESESNAVDEHLRLRDEMLATSDSQGPHAVSQYLQQSQKASFFRLDNWLLWLVVGVVLVGVLVQVVWITVHS